MTNNHWQRTTRSSRRRKKPRFYLLALCVCDASNVIMKCAQADDIHTHIDEEEEKEKSEGNNGEREEKSSNVDNTIQWAKIINKR